jgi:cytosine/adenosine deaminase-related metal-dependent hydrolase
LDLLIADGTVVTMNPAREVLLGSDVLVQGGRIAQVGRRLSRGKGALRVLDATHHAVLPGFVHGHLHVCQTLFRNQADGLALLEWLRERIWPLEAAHDERSMRASADLAFAELIKGGSTAALDMGTVRHTDVIFESARDCGFRLTGGKAMMDLGEGLPAPLRESAAESMAESLRLIKSWHQTQGGRLRYALAPRFALSCSQELLRAVASESRQVSVRIHTHASENASECEAVRLRTGRENVDYLHWLGLTGPEVTLAHCVWLTHGERGVLRDTQTRVCHCPSSNLKLASGLAQIPEMIGDGVQVALGADGAACNNNLDMFMEMRLAALIHKPRVGPASMSPLQVLEMATLGGARALGLEAEIGSIEVGKRADLAIVSLDGAHAQPSSPDVAGQLVYSGRSADVRHVLIDGQMVMSQRQLLTLDEEAVTAKARREAQRLGSATP